MDLFKHGKLMLAGALMVAGIGMSSCSDSTSADGTANVQMSAEMDQGGVGALAAIKGGAKTSAAGNEVDSIYVTRIRLLISNLKMHQGNDADSANTEKDRTVKVGPFLVQYDSAGSHVFTNASVPAGSYDRIKFEFHKLTNSEKDTYLNDPLFQDFVTDDRYTVIIDGWVWDEGVMSQFTYRSKATDNLQVRFDPDLVLAEGTTTNLALQFSPKAVFKKGSNMPLDPRDGSNHSEMEKAIKDAFKMLKKG
jgi:hypothetical protein